MDAERNAPEPAAIMTHFRNRKGALRSASMHATFGLFTTWSNQRMTKLAIPNLPLATIRQPMAIRHLSYAILSQLGSVPPSFAAGAVLLMFLSASGCGSTSKLEITGKLTKKGQPYQPPPMTLVT